MITINSEHLEHVEQVDLMWPSISFFFFYIYINPLALKSKHRLALEKLKVHH